MLADSFIQFCMSVYFLFHMYSDKIKGCFIKLCCYLPCIDTIHTFIFQMPKMYDFHCSNAKYMNPSRETSPLKLPHQCDSEGGRIRGALLYKTNYSLFKGALYRIWCGVNRLGDSGVNVV